MTIARAARCPGPGTVADRLLRHWGTLPRVLAAPRARVAAVGGDAAVAEALCRFRDAVLHVLRCPVAAQPVLSDWQALLDYLRADMAHLVAERFRVLHLNSRNRLIGDEIMWEGTVDESPVHVREVIRRAMDLGSVALILVHNHPSGDPTPSRADVEITRVIADAGRALGIAVHDHVVIGTNGHVSLRARGLV